MRKGAFSRVPKVTLVGKKKLESSGQGKRRRGPGGDPVLRLRPAPKKKGETETNEDVGLKELLLGKLKSSGGEISKGPDENFSKSGMDGQKRRATSCR